jgi:hypothetical protein
MHAELMVLLVQLELVLDMQAWKRTYSFRFSALNGI